MRSIALVCSALLAGCGSGEGGAASSDVGALDDATDAPSPDDSADTDTDADADETVPVPSVRLVGRFSDKHEFAWSGSQIIARFDGTGAHLRLNAGANQQFQIVVDGKATHVLKPTGGSKRYDAAIGLASGAHEVVVWRRTEAFEGVSTYEGFDFDGTPLPPAAAPARRIEIVGDSLSCGYGDEGAGPSCPFTADTENHYLAYGAIAAKSLGADLVTTCWSGIGMVRDYGGSTADQMPVRYLRTLPESTTSAWDFSKFAPQAVVINLGSNDFHGGDPGTPFETAYLDFVRTVRTKYPSAYILAVVPLSAAKAHIDAVVAARNGAGDANIGTFTPSAVAVADGWGCDYHPTVATHAKWGAELASALASKLGW